MSSKELRTESAIFKTGFKEPYLRANEKPFIKLLNWYTGFGKTYTAAAYAVELFVMCDVIPVFIAPLQSLVSGFSDDVGKHQKHEYADEIEAAVKARGKPIPVHRLYSMDYHHNDRTFFKACLGLVAWLEHRPALCDRMDQGSKRSPADKGTRMKLRELRIKAEACEASTFLAMSAGDERYKDVKDAYLKEARQAYTLANRFTSKLIRFDIDSRAQGRDEERYMQAPAVAEMVRRLHPLQAFLDNPGIIVSTAAKAQVAQEVYAPAPEPGKFRPYAFENLPEFLEELNTDGSILGRMVSRRPDSARVVTFVDEEEDSYWYLFEHRKSVVNSGGRTDLNVVISEFYQYFDLKWPMAFERLEHDGPRLALADKVYRYLEHFAAVSKSVEDEFKREIDRTKAKYIPDDRRVAILRTALLSEFAETAAEFNDEELLIVLNQLHDRNDAHKNFKRFRQKAKVLQRMRKYIVDVMQQGSTAYETFRRVHELVADKKYFTMSRATYGEVMEQPGQTFFTQSANVMTTEFLKQVELTRDTAHQTVRLLYHDGDVAPGAFTLLDYLKFVVFMAKVLTQQTGEDVIEMSEQDVERYPVLYRFRSDVRKLFKGRTTEEGLDEETNQDELITDGFLFEHTKSVVTLEESSTQAEEYNLEADVSLTLTITSLKATPEEDVVRALGRTNGVYLMSATGGLQSASSGAFNVARLRRCLDAKGGYFSDMTEQELAVVSAKALEQLAMRERKVVILNDEKPSTGFSVSGQFRGLLDQFTAAIPARDQEGYARMNRHKKHELEGLVASLDKLMSTSVRSGLVLCQTVRHVQKCLVRLANSDLGLVTRGDNKGDLFIIHPGAVPTYAKFGQDDITLVLYTAGRFRKTDRSKTGAVEEDDDDGQFNRELEEALDINNKKVLLWTAYSSASRGINFLTKYKGKKRDFELFCLLNDPYYTHHTRPGEAGFSMEMFQSFLQVLRDENDDWASMSKGELLFQYSRNRYKRLRKEHVIDITRIVFQALGRGERRPEVQMPCQQLYVSSEAARMVHLGLRHAPELRKRASPAQRAVLHELERHNAETSIFPTEQQRQSHHQQSLRTAVEFQTFTRDTPNRFRSDPNARATWQKLFHPDMFITPQRYLEQLEKAGVPAEYRNGCFTRVPATSEPFTCDFSSAGYTATVITDAFDGAAVYNWVADLAPESLHAKLSERTQSFLKQWHGFAVPGSAERLVPQPWFVKEIMKGYIAELQFEEYIAEQFNVRPSDIDCGGRVLEYLNPCGHELEADIYQVFDYYLVPRPGVLVAVDVKNWTQAADAAMSELPKRAQEKHAQLSALFPDRTVHALYVNLHGAYKAPVTRPARGSIRFMSLFVPGTGKEGWIANTNLRDAVLGK
jgi:hypothetical protein